MLVALSVLRRVQRFIVKSEYFNPSGDTEVRLLTTEKSVVDSSMTAFSAFKSSH